MLVRRCAHIYMQAHMQVHAVYVHSRMHLYLQWHVCVRNNFGHFAVIYCVSRDAYHTKHIQIKM